MDYPACLAPSCRPDQSLTRRTGARLPHLARTKQNRPRQTRTHHACPAIFCRAESHPAAQITPRLPCRATSCRAETEPDLRALPASTCRTPPMLVAPHQNQAGHTQPATSRPNLTEPISPKTNAPRLPRPIGPRPAVPCAADHACPTQSRRYRTNHACRASSGRAQSNFSPPCLPRRDATHYAWTNRCRLACRTKTCPTLYCQTGHVATCLP
jgi:hypothetical protein